MLHLYWGDGKGKTTAAMGLALRALGRGWRVCIVQFLKSGQSGELEPLRRLGAKVLACETDGKFSWQLSPSERADLRSRQTQLLEKALEYPAQLLILDEACAACALDLVDEAALRTAVLEQATRCEVVLTGRNPAAWMLESADYCTQMCAVAHPFDKGQQAREGVEF